ncbi:histone-like nucleoid-structuring protein Lsr2 [Gandjariella thermophila]|uniref:Lsr2 dimerization domain-containing protein n=1 Tax=Gandjariella thermophila TaxID=1931992 RepID=A0A4D4JDV5_9PSEU|nr:Lsr2 family protein [Gandjariella thermophila]GDY32083.1 hypothetical protein GTS_37160 [Gandjariella thermophila]
MAQHVRVELVDDLDGSPAQETIEFGLDGLMYTIDLSAANARQLRAALAPYVAGARRSAARRSAPDKVTRRRADQPGSDRKGDDTTARIRALTERIRQNQRSSVPEAPGSNGTEPEEATITLPAVVETGKASEPQPVTPVVAPVFQPPQR